jgi:hypothetical protein
VRRTCSTFEELQQDTIGLFLNSLGLPANCVRFMRASQCENTGNCDGRDHRPIIVELDQDSDAERLHLLESIQREHSGRNIFFFGVSASSLSGASQQKSPIDSASESQDPCHVSFSDDAVWGPLRNLQTQWRLSLASREAGIGVESGTWHPLIEINGRSWFLRKSNRAASSFLWASEKVPNLSAPVGAAEEEQAECLLRVLPLVAFLRHAFADQVWRPPAHFANMIVDDPPIWDRYGSFSPTRLLSSLAGLPHAATVAFIPWNWNRSASSAVEVFRSQRLHLSLCVHGCDHTQGEFASLSEEELAGKCLLALQRIDNLQKNTGLDCKPVMVFPQGLFSKCALAALQKTGFLAAVNSTLFPIDHSSADLRLADLLEPAYTGINDFPVFLRRYPSDPVLCAIDLYLGRPLLVVEHQEYFRDGYEACRQFFETVSRFPCKLNWAPLDQVARESCLQRQTQPDVTEVRFYTDDFVLRNPRSRNVTYRLTRRLNQPELIARVLLDGVPVDYEKDHAGISFFAQLEPNACARINLRRPDPSLREPFRGSLAYRMRVRLRRVLCDARDHHVWLAGGAKFVKSAWKLRAVF